MLEQGGSDSATTAGFDVIGVGRPQTAMSYGIIDIGVYVPEQRVSAAARASALGMSDQTLRHRIGFESLARK